MNPQFLPAIAPDDGPAWQQTVFAFLAEKERRSGSRRTVEGYARLLWQFLLRVGSPELVTPAHVLAWAYGIDSGRWVCSPPDWSPDGTEVMPWPRARRRSRSSPSMARVCRWRFRSESRPAGFQAGNGSRPDPRHGYGRSRPTLIVQIPCVLR